jgi:hypothetical protein
LKIGAHVLSGVRPLDEDSEIVAATAKRLAQGAVVFDATTPLHDFLRVGLIAPEIGIGDRFLDLGKLVV